MKEITNKKFDLFVLPEVSATTANLLEFALNQAPQGGFSLAVIKARLRVSKAFENVEINDVIKLEDADFETAKSAIAEARWGVSHPDIIKFSEQFGL